MKFPKTKIIYQNEYFFVRKDEFPVSPGHCLIISEFKKDYFDLSDDERNNLGAVILEVKKLIEQEYKPDGYNIGMNCGESAGQSMFQFHCHVIPRYKGDTENPRGGIRKCVNGNGDY